MSPIRSILASARTIPVLAFKSADEAVHVCGILIEEGFKVLELTMRHPSALDALTAVKKAYGERAAIGMGTITKASEIGGVVAAGADFGVSPGLTHSLAHAVTTRGFPFLPAIATVSEAMAAREMGFETLKFFPAEQSGGTGFLKAAKAVLPDIRFCPTGGLTENNAQAYLALENVMCFGSSAFVVRNAGENIDEAAIRQVIAAFRQQRLID